ncbi:MAG TPA: two-component regulator propeller domain-containing protein [Patescibacteria group bacterium]|nr:two-component regulator propeller domain-containing protein [Patescibacteria group bacterium]
MHRPLVACAFLLACSSGLAASTVADVATIESVRFRSISVDQGLSQPTVRTILQDRRGFVWIGTLDGLNRSDGNRIRVFRHRTGDANSLSDNHVSALIEDSDGRLWIGTGGGGVNRYDPERDRFEHFRHDAGRKTSLAGDGVTAMARGIDGALWVATLAGGLQRMNAGSDEFSPARDAGRLKGLDTTREISVRRNGNLLVATRLGTYELDPVGALVREWRDAELGAIDSFAVAEDLDGAVWIGSGDAGLFRVAADGAVSRWNKRTQGLADDSVRALQVGQDGALWVGTLSGLTRLDVRRGELRNWRYDPYGRVGLGAHRIESLAIDRDGLVWVGTWANGVSLHDPDTSGFRLAPFRPGDARYLPRPTAIAVAPARGGKLWIGMHEEGGVALLDPKSGVERVYVHDPEDAGSIGSSTVQTLLETRDGSLWVGSPTAGLSRLAADAATFEHFLPNPADPTTLPGRNVAGLFEDRDGALWVSMLGTGVVRQCSGCAGFERFEALSGGRSLPLQVVNLAYQTRDGAMWFGMRSEGLVRFDPGSRELAHYAPGGEGALSNGVITCLHEDASGVLWVATQGGGLNRGERAAQGRYRFRAIRRSDGLAADAIAALAEDADGHLWISHSTGISRLNMDDRSLVNFDWSEGTQSRGYFVGAVAKGVNGEIYFGGLEGLTLFDPHAVREPRAPKPPVVSAISVLGSNAIVGGEIESGLRRLTPRDGTVLLTHRDKVFDVDLSAFNFTHPTSIRYAYQLDGFDDHWIALAAGTSTASFTALPSGDYGLRLRAAGPGSRAWIESTEPLRVRVLPAPWWSWWAWTLYGSTALIAFWMLLQRGTRVARARIEQQRRLRQSEEWLSMALESSGDEIWDADLANGTIVRRNANPETVIPDRDRLQLQDIYAAVHPDDQQGFLDAYHAAIKGAQERMKASFRIATRAGGWLWALSYGRVVERDGEGRATRLIGVSRDITDIMQHEEALQKLNAELEHRVDARTRDLQGANGQLRRTLDELRLAQKQLVESEKMAALGALVAGVAHEINTPLGIGVTAASHLETESKRVRALVAENGLKRSDLESYLSVAGDSSELILRNLKRADHLVKSFKQVAVDQSSEQRRVIELAEYLDEILTSLHPRLKRTQHEVVVDCDPSIRVNTYPGALYQVVVNLVINSLVHGFEGIEQGTVRIDVRCADGQVEFDYRDDGRGMEEPVRTRIFEPFFTTKRGQGGSGLGMHIVYNLVTQMLGGTLACESTPGNGVRFLLRFPQGELAANA